MVWITIAVVVAAVLPFVRNSSQAGFEPPNHPRYKKRQPRKAGASKFLVETGESRTTFTPKIKTLAERYAFAILF